MRGRAGVRVRVCLPSVFPLPHRSSRIKWLPLLEHHQLGSSSPAVVTGMCLFLLPKVPGMGRGGSVWEEGRRGALCLGIGEGGDLVFKEWSFWAGSDLRGGTGARVMEKVWTPDLDLGRKCL